MPSALPSRTPLPGSGPALGVTIPLVRKSEEFPVIRLSKFHLDQVNETYFQHLHAALGIALRLAIASASCALHAVVPGLCTRSASRRVAAIHAQLARRSDACEQLRHASGNCRPGPPQHIDIEDC